MDDVTLTGIHLVPPEILLRIFLVAALSYSAAYRREKHNISWPWSSDLVSISRTCRLWRELALSTTALWVPLLHFPSSQLEDAPLPWQVELFRRTGNAPLDLVFHRTKKGPRSIWNPNQGFQWVGSCDLELSDRLRSFEYDPGRFNEGIRLPLETIERHLNALAGKSLPLLTSVMIRRSQSYTIDGPFDPLLFRVEPTMAPNLKELRLERVSVDLTKPLFRNLRILSIIWPPPRPMSHLGISEWLGLLRNMPHLTDLTIKGSITRGPPFLYSDSPILLPKLQTLSLGSPGETSAVSHLLQHIATPKACNLYLSCRVSGHRPLLDNGNYLKVGLARWFDRWKDADFASTKVYTSISDNRFIIHNQSGAAPWPGSYFRITLFFYSEDLRPYMHDLGTFVRSVLCVLQPICLPKIRTLVIWLSIEPTCISYVELISFFPSLQEVAIHDLPWHSVRSSYPSEMFWKHDVERALNHVINPCLRVGSFNDNPLLPTLRTVTFRWSYKKNTVKIKAFSIEELWQKAVMKGVSDGDWKLMSRCLVELITNFSTRRNISTESH